MLRVSPEKTRTAAAQGHILHQASAYGCDDDMEDVEYVEYASQQQPTNHGTNGYATHSQQQYTPGDYMSPQRQEAKSSSKQRPAVIHQYGPVSDPGGRASQPQHVSTAVGQDSSYPAPGRTSPSISASGQLNTAPTLSTTAPSTTMTTAANNSAAPAGYTNGHYSSYHRTSTATTTRPAPVSTTSASTLHVPPDIPGQVRLLNFLIMKLTSGADALDQLHSMKAKCSQVGQDPVKTPRK